MRNDKQMGLYDISTLWKPVLFVKLCVLFVKLLHIISKGGPPGTMGERQQKNIWTSWNVWRGKIINTLVSYIFKLVIPLTPKI